MRSCEVFDESLAPAPSCKLYADLFCQAHSSCNLLALSVAEGSYESLVSKFFPATKREKYDWHLDSDSCVYVLRASASWAKSSRFLVSRNPVDRFVSEMLSRK